MFAVQALALVLVTGGQHIVSVLLKKPICGTGFVGSAIIVNLLQKDFLVRAAIRSTSKISLFPQYLKGYIDSGKLSFVVIPNMITPNAFKDAIQGVEGVIHAASPLSPGDPLADPKDVLEPAIDMTLRVLVDAATNSIIKRVVVTNFVVTLLEPHEGENISTPSAPEIVEKMGANTSGSLKYIASKVLAEQATWKWMTGRKPSFELVTVLPPWVWGRDSFSNPDTIHPSASNACILRGLSDAKYGRLQESYLSITEFTDILDIAEGHVRALVTVTPAAAGERIALKGGHATWQDNFDLVNASHIPGIVAPLGNPGVGKTFSPEKYFVAEKATTILGMTYRPMEETLLNAIRSGIELGWKQ
ncbi:methylglyoxal reductase (NADPH-dependent) gre2 [Serendipita sp. 399]|nr:methylglyoxal reductase (NADPH-dependent) gre2 [Serendipita sp. 399]